MLIHQLKFQTPIAGGILLLAYTFGVVQGGSMAAIGIAGAALLYLLAAYVAWRWLCPDLRLGALLIAILLASALAATHSDEPTRSWRMVFQIASFLLPLWLITALPVQQSLSPKFFAWLLLAVVLQTGLMLADSLTGGSVIQLIYHPLTISTFSVDNFSFYKRGLSYLAVLLWPLLALLLWQRRLLAAAALYVLAVVTAYHCDADSALLAMLAAGVVFMLAHWQAKFIALLLGGGLIIASFGWPWAAQAIVGAQPDWLQQLPTSWHHRLEIWDNFANHIAARPWFGWGPNMAGQLPVAGDHVPLYQFLQVQVAHTHNVFTQLWVEIGLPGLLVGLAFGLITLKRCAGAADSLRPATLAAWVAALVMTLISFNFWSDSLWATLAVMWLCFRLLPPAAPDKP
jgi:O-antigen ligase